MNINHDMKKFITNLFRDKNDINEKAIVGFLSFVIMTIFAISDIVSGYMGKDVEINEVIFNSFLWLVLGSFGIASVDKFINKKMCNENKENNPDEEYNEDLNDDYKNPQ